MIPKLAALLIVLFVAVAVFAEPIALELKVQAVASIGEAVPMNLIFHNVGSASIYLEYSGADYGAETLTICAQRDGKWFNTGAAHFDRDLAALRFDFIPLRSEHKLEVPILAINDPGAASLPNLILREPGTYEIFARYTSRGNVHEGMFWPIWRGVVTTKTYTLSLANPTVETLAAKRDALLACLSSEAECATEVIGYFRMVRDAAATDILVALLDATDVPDPTLLEAVANQTESTKRNDALKRFADRFTGVSEEAVRSPDAGLSVSSCIDHSKR